MKKEYKEPIVETVDMDLSALMLVTSLGPGEGYIDPDADPDDSGGAAKGIIW